MVLKSVNLVLKRYGK